MVGKVSIKRASLPADAASVALEKRGLGMARKVVPVAGSTSEIVAKSKPKFAKTGPVQIQVRKMGRGGPTETSSRARALKACKGKRGCEFAECVKAALGRLPYSLRVACPTA